MKESENLIMNGNGFPFKKRESPLAATTQTAPIAKPIAVAPARVKYTATMEKELRKRVKFAAAKRDIQISQYIEEAVLAKLESDGE